MSKGWRVKVRIEKSGGDPYTTIKQFSYGIYMILQGEMVEVASNVAEGIGKYIDSRRVREKTYPGAGKLGKIFSDIDIDSNIARYTVVGIGDKDRLKKEACYWEILDSGKTKSGSRFIPYNGNFVPYGGFAGGTAGRKPQSDAHGGSWNRGTRPPFTFKPKKFVEGINYIAKTSAVLASEWEKASSKIQWESRRV